MKGKPAAANELYDLNCIIWSTDNEDMFAQHHRVMHKRYDHTDRNE